MTNSTFVFSTADIVAAFQQKIQAAGMVPPNKISLGTITRFSDNGSSNNSNGWCTLFINPNGSAGGAFGNWKNINEKWFHSSQGQEISQEENEEFKKQFEAVRKKAEAERKEKQQAAAAAATKEWEAAGAALATHGYLSRKKIKPHCARQAGEALIIPVLDDKGDIMTLQRIFPDGDKLFKKGGKIAGGYCLLGDCTTSDVILIVEGFATGATVQEATGKAVVVCFNSGNLKAVSKMIKEKYPDKTITIAADNDILTAGKKGFNPGKDTGEQAAKATGIGMVLCPVNSDFNDMAVEHGLDAVREALSKYHLEPPADEGKIVDDALSWIAATGDNRAIINGWLDRVKGLNSTDTDIVKDAVQKKTKTKISNLNKDLKKRQKKDKAAELKKKREKVSTERGSAGVKEIIYKPTATGVCCHEVSEALRNHPEKLVYRFAGNLVKIINRQPSTVRMVKKIHDQGGKYPSMPILSPMGSETLCHEVEKVAVCQSTDAEGNIVDIPWPKTIMTGVMALTESHEKPLVSVVEHPYIDDDFDPVLTQGYDERTGLYRSFDIKPSLDQFKDPMAALLFLTDEVFQDFPFASDLDTIAAVSCLLTGMQRKLIADDSGCPGYLFTAPMQSSGKTTLCQIINHILYGRPAAAASYSDDDTEMGKLLLGILKEGHSCILFDNLPEGSSVESNELSKCITSDSYSNRWLGENKTISVPCSCLWLMTGNNVSLCGDFNTRILNVEIDSKEQNPDQRHFKRSDIGLWCGNNRAKILGACLQVIMHGKDYSNKDLNPSRFPTWDKFVRLPLYKLTEIDVADIFQKNKMSDPKIEGQRNFFGAWFNAFGSSPVTAKQVLDSSQPGNEIAEALMDIFSGGSLPSTRALGKWLAGMKNRFFGDYKLIHGGKGSNREQKKQIVWMVQDINDENNMK